MDTSLNSILLISLIYNEPLTINLHFQDRLADSGEQNRYMIKVALDNGAMAAKLAGAGGGGTIIVLTFSPDKIKRALKEAGAKEFVELEPKDKGVTVEHIYEDGVFLQQSLKHGRGDRDIDFMAYFFDAKKPDGICNGPDNSFRGIYTNEGTSCEAWEAFRQNR